MLFEDLITVIESKPEIWCIGNELFNNPTASDKAWKEIARTFDCDVDTIKNRWQDLKAQYQKQLEEESVATGEMPHDDQSEKRSHQDLTDLESNEDLGEQKSQENQHLCEKREGLIRETGSTQEVSNNETSIEDPISHAHRLSEKGFNAMHFIKNQITSETESNSKSGIKTNSEALEPETQHTSSQSVKSQETPSNEDSSTGYLIPIPLKNLAALEHGNGGLSEFLDAIDSFSFEDMIPSLLELADALRRDDSGSESDDA